MPIERKGHFIRERIHSPKRYKRLRTEVRGTHRLIIGVLPDGYAEVQAILHPTSEGIVHVRASHRARAYARRRGLTHRGGE